MFIATWMAYRVASEVDQPFVEQQALTQNGRLCIIVMMQIHGFIQAVVMTHQY